MKLSKELKKKSLVQKIGNVSLRQYDYELALMVAEAVGDGPDVIKGLKSKITKQQQAIEVLETELNKVNAEEDSESEV